MSKNTVESDYLRHQAVGYLKHWLGVPYFWGGDDPMQGFDCSGLIVEVLQGVGLIPHKSDFTADGLYRMFKEGERIKGHAGCLVFWFDTYNRAVHVEMMIDDRFVIGASGGGSSTTTLADAIKQNAFIKMRPLNYRGSNFKIVDPFKE